MRIDYLCPFSLILGILIFSPSPLGGNPFKFSQLKNPFQKPEWALPLKREPSWGISQDFQIKSGPVFKGVEGNYRHLLVPGYFNGVISSSNQKVALFDKRALFRGEKFGFAGSIYVCLKIEKDGILAEKTDPSPTRDLIFFGR